MDLHLLWNLESNHYHTCDPWHMDSDWTICALGSGVCIYTYPGGTPLFSLRCVLSLSTGGAGGIPGQCGTRRGAGAPVFLHLHCVSGFIALPLGEGRQQSYWLLRTITGRHSNPAFSLVCPGNTTPRVFSSRTSTRGVLISCCVSSYGAQENTSLAILARFKARCISDSSSCTRPACIAIVAEMFRTCKKLVPASKVRFGYYRYHIRLHRLFYPTKPVLSIPGDIYHEIGLGKCQDWEHHDVKFRAMCGNIPWWTIVVSHYGQQSSGHVVLSAPKLCFTLSADHLQ